MEVCLCSWPWEDQVTGELSGGGGLMSEKVLACTGRDCTWDLSLFLPPCGLLPTPIHPSPLPSHPYVCPPSSSLHSKSVELPPICSIRGCILCWPTGELGKVYFKGRPWLVGLGGIVRKTTLENRQFK